MFAVHDQENLVHGQQAAAAAKPLNQGVRQLPPKTPGNRAPKTPFKIPLNDENADHGLAGLKGTLKAKGAGSNAFVTPMGPKSRAPLGAKTTNAKTKAFQTPAPTINGDLAKSKKNSVSAQKAKPKPKPAETTKLEVLDDKEVDDIPEIEYMPPRSQDLPDLPDDHVELDYSILSKVDPLQAAAWEVANEIGYDGLTYRERTQKREKDRVALLLKKEEAKEQLELDSIAIPCMHEPECPTELCKDTIKARKAAQETYDRTMAILNAETAPKKLTKSPGKAPPTTAHSKIAATAIARPKSATKAVDPVKKPMTLPVRPRLTSTLAAASKKPAPAKKAPAINHRAAVAASRTTVGQAKGRAVSNSLKKQASPEKPAGFVPFEERDTSVSAPEYWRRYGTPPLDSNMWYECWRRGFLREGGDNREDEEQKKEREERDRILDEALRQEALEDFQLTL